MAGEGSVFRRASDGAWLAQLSIGPREHRSYVTRSARTKGEARRKLDELRAGLRAPTKLTVGAYLETWVDEARDIRDATRHAYRAAIVTHIAPAIGSRLLAELSPTDVERLLFRLAPRMAPKTVRNIHAVLRRGLRQAVRAGLLTRNVADRQYIDAPRVPVAEPRALSAAEVARLLAAAHGDPLEALYVMALGTGLRQGELLGLEWQDVAGPEVTVRQALALRDGRYKPSEPKTESSKRAVPMSPSVCAAIDAHRERVKAQGFVPVATGPVFVNRKGRALSGSWVTHRFYRILERAGIARLPFKNLRTTFGSRLSEAGVSDMEIARLMGHARTHTTKRHYITLTGRSSEPAVVAIEAFLNQSPVTDSNRGVVSGGVVQ